MQRLGGLGGVRVAGRTCIKSMPSASSSGMDLARSCGRHCGNSCQSRSLDTPGHTLSLGVPSILQYGHAPPPVTACRGCPTRLRFLFANLCRGPGEGRKELQVPQAGSSTRVVTHLKICSSCCSSESPGNRGDL